MILYFSSQSFIVNDQAAQGLNHMKFARPRPPRGGAPYPPGSKAVIGFDKLLTAGGGTTAPSPNGVHASVIRVKNNDAVPVKFNLQYIRIGGVSMAQPGRSQQSAQEYIVQPGAEEDLSFSDDVQLAWEGGDIFRINVECESTTGLCEFVPTAGTVCDTP